jgi:O-antigen/teichoic acid export membrane protein
MTHRRPASASGTHRSLIARIPTVGAGLLDVGASSAATFACGLIAARLLDPHVLGAYGLAFRVLVLAMTVPTYLVFQPREVEAMRLDESVRLRLFWQGMRIGIPVALTTAFMSALWPLSLPAGVERSAVTALNVTMCAVAVLSPLQDFLRRLFHLSGRSWSAARVSLIQLVVVTVGLALVMTGAVRLSSAWIPLGLLALANAVSLVCGMIFSWTSLRGGSPEFPDAKAGLLTSGAWLLFMAVIPNVTAVLVGIVLAQVRGSDALGYLEAARIVAQPILVFSIGLGAVLGPRSVAAAQSQQRTQARKLARQFNSSVLLMGIAYAIVCAAPHGINVLAWLVPRAFTVPGIVMLTIAANISLGLAMPERNELQGARQSRFLAWAETVANAARLGCGFLAGLIGMFALPLGLLMQGLIRWGLLHFRVARLYPRAPVPTVPASEFSV